MVAPEQHVLSVVDGLAGLRVDKRGGTAAEAGPGLEHQHARPAFRERAAVDSPANPAPMTMASGCHRGLPATAARHVDAAITARRGRGTRTVALKTSYPDRSIRSRIAR